ncbi:MAG: ATP-binding protein [Flavobacterium sp.]
MSSKKIIFEPRARLLLQLGDQLIRNESIAFMELIKNSYDANASFVKVYMRKVNNKKLGEIVIEDDGIGMNIDIITNIWMQPGSDHKLKILDSIKNKLDERMPIGEKGIGRFGVHKLGYVIELTSKMQYGKEVYLKINWRDFEKDDLLKNIKVNIVERDEPEYFIDGMTGTHIVIRDLKAEWNRGTVRELYRSVNSLGSPFDNLNSFKVYFSIDNQDWLTGLMSFKQIRDYALYYAEATIEKNQILKLEYEFKPWDTMSKVEGRKVLLEKILMVKDVKDETTKKTIQKEIDLSADNTNIGSINFKLLIFDRENKILSLGVSDKKGFTGYLDTNGGIRVFRSGIRVYDYGEQSNDWLGLDMMRVNQPGKTISNNIIIGAINLDRRSSKSLEEKTNREGFVEDDAYFKFKDAIFFTLDKILTQRNIDKEKVRKFYSTSSVSQPVIGSLAILQDKIIEKVPKKDQDELLSSIRTIENDYKTISEIYMRSSSAGLSLGIVIHEVIHMIAELVAAVKKKPVDNYINDLIKSLQKTVSDYAGVIKQSPKSKEDLIEVIDQALSNIQYRIKAHELEIVPQYKKRVNINTTVRCSRSLIISTIINLTDNSIWWQNYANVKSKKLYVDIIEEPQGYVSILIADNGPGFTISPEDAVKPFISDKPGGMGLGLHLADEVMTSQKGLLIFPEPNEFDIPEDFNKGAKLLLAIKK